VTDVKLPKIRRRLLFGLTLIGVVILGLGTFVYTNPLLFKEFKDLILPSTKVPEEKMIILELQTEYSLCKHLEIEQIEYKSDDQLQQDLEDKTGYRLVEALEDRHIYKRVVNDVCKNCKDNQFIGIAEGKIAIFKGTPNQPGPVSEYLNIQIDLLPQAELNDLSKGIPFKDDKEKLQLLEGLIMD
jgi:hypothetical protein